MIHKACLIHLDQDDTLSENCPFCGQNWSAELEHIRAQILKIRLDLERVSLVMQIGFQEAKQMFQAMQRSFGKVGNIVKFVEQLKLDTQRIQDYGNILNSLPKPPTETPYWQNPSPWTYQPAKRTRSRPPKGPRMAHQIRKDRR